MKDCPLCGGVGATQHTPKKLPFIECTTPRCRAAAKPAATEALAVRSWDTFVRASEGIPGDWSLYPPPVSQCA